MPDATMIAHISDVHLTPISGLTARHLNVKRALGLANWLRSRRHVHRPEVTDALIDDLRLHGAHHIAVTGDLCNIGLPGEYAAAAVWLEALGPPDKVSVVPGNHDIYSALGAHQGVELWRPYMRSDAFGTAVPRVASGPRGFPYVRRVGNAALIGLNSAVETRPFVAAGELGRTQLEALREILLHLAGTGLARVVLIHHPPLPGLAPVRRALTDAADLAAVLATSGAELVLHGHNHRDMLNWCEGSGVRIPVVGIASGSAGRRHKSEPLARYNLIRLRRADGTFKIEVMGRGLAPSGGVIIDLDRHTLTPHAAAAQL